MVYITYILAWHVLALMIVWHYLSDVNVDSWLVIRCYMNSLKEKALNTVESWQNDKQIETTERLEQVYHICLKRPGFHFIYINKL